VLHQEGFLKPVGDVFGARGREWLGRIGLSEAGRGTVELWLRLIDQVNRELAVLQQAIEAMARQDVRARWLMTIPGIAAYSAMLIVGEIGDVARFASKRALASYAGLTPVVRESAGKRKRGSIGHHGSGMLRWIMLQVAQVAARHSPAARAWYRQLKQRKPAQVARIALARKLLTAVWALLRHGVCFDERVFARQG
jgi:transposase